MKGIVSSSSCYVDPFYYFSRLYGVNQPPKRFVYKNERKEGGKKEVVVSYFESGNSPEAGRKKSRPIRVDYKRDNYLEFYRAVVDELHHELSNTRSQYLNLI
ncbi:hypothetical protein NC653_031525 [Populus alba x Populus x berolinensis]|uniref:Uncharacterized protein n=1 Tax=Populus alba x Populus x berolinensis TaxID=444605 RepID=A0AAD6LZ03_9ROSI|nr:hypothetical protein NC653_031525 [Populus alba x Populus x berolinensis]